MVRFISFAAVIAVLLFVAYVVVRRISLRAEQHRCPVCLNGGSPIDYPARTSDGLKLCRKHSAQRHHIETMEQNLKEMP